MTKQQTSNSETPVIPQQFLDLKTIPERLYLDWERYICNDEDLTKAALNLLNWDFRSNYCQDLPNDWWARTSEENMKVHISDHTFRLGFCVPVGMEWYFPYLTCDELISSSIEDMDYNSEESGRKILEIMRHPLLRWINDKCKILKDVFPYDNIIAVLPVKVLLIVALRDLVANSTAGIPVSLKEDFMMVYDSYLKFERF